MDPLVLPVIHPGAAAGKELGQPKVPTRSPYRGAEFLVNTGFRREETGFIDLIKGDDQAVNNSTTLVDDTDLQCYLDERQHFSLLGMIGYSADGTADFKLQLAAATGVAIRAVLLGFDTGGTWTAQYMDESTSRSLRGSGAAVMEIALLIGWVDTDTTAGGNGSFKVQFAQNALHASDAKLLHASWIQLKRLGGSFA